MSESKEKRAYHPIQLRTVFVRELSIKALLLPEEEKEGSVPAYALQTGYSTYDEATNTVSVGVQVVVDESQKGDSLPLPYTLRIEVLGQFVVDDKTFPKDKISDWAQRNAPLILLPYARELVYAMTTKAGFKPLILPLFQVPTIAVS